MLISVIIPVYNVAPYLPKCLDSILAQTHRNLEIILIDDGSEDSSGTICNEYAQKDQRIQVIHKANGGLSSARNAGLDIATGAYIAFIDSDDFIMPRMFLAMLAAMTRENADMAICGVQWVDESSGKGWKESLKNGVMDNKQVLRAMLQDIPCIAGITNKLYKFSLVQNIRFPVGRLMEDVFILHRFLDKSQKAVILKDEFYIYLWPRQGSIMSTYSEKHFLEEWEGLYDRYLFFKGKGKGFGYHRRHSIKQMYRFLIRSTFQRRGFEEHKKIIVSLYKKTFWLLVKYGDWRAGKLFYIGIRGLSAARQNDGGVKDNKEAECEVLEARLRTVIRSHDNLQ